MKLTKYEIMEKYGLKYNTIDNWVNHYGLFKDTRLCEDGRYRVFIDEKDLPCLLLPDNKKGFNFTVRTTKRLLKAYHTYLEREDRYLDLCNEINIVC